MSEAPLTTEQASLQLSTLVDKIKADIKLAENLATKYELPFSIWMGDEAGGDFGLPEGYINEYGEYSYLDEYSDIDWNDEVAVAKFTAEYGEEHVQVMRDRTYVWNRWISSSEHC